jgi:hypothetical protein
MQINVLIVDDSEMARNFHSYILKVRALKPYQQWMALMP